ncbi:hypothetical protein DFH09DRAFT_499494 [Mycena vulgaris]|nr:hypothetical protein DFH09DRAFT_499494 [Mycena vulgaris]
MRSMEDGRRARSHTAYMTSFRPHRPRTSPPSALSTGLIFTFLLCSPRHAHIVSGSGAYQQPQNLVCARTFRPAHFARASRASALSASALLLRWPVRDPRAQILPPLHCGVAGAECERDEEEGTFARGALPLISLPTPPRTPDTILPRYLVHASPAPYSATPPSRAGLCIPTPVCLAPLPFTQTEPLVHRRTPESARRVVKDFKLLGRHVADVVLRAPNLSRSYGYEPHIRCTPCDTADPCRYKGLVHSDMAPRTESPTPPTRPRLCGPPRRDIAPPHRAVAASTRFLKNRHRKNQQRPPPPGAPIPILEPTSAPALRPSLDCCGAYARLWDVS